MRENTDQNNSEYKLLLRSVCNPTLANIQHKNPNESVEI